MKSKFILLAAIVVGGCLAIIVGCNRGSRQRAAKEIEGRATKAIENIPMMLGVDDVIWLQSDQSKKRDAVLAMDADKCLMGINGGCVADVTAAVLFI